MCSAISIATCFTFFPWNEFGFLHDAFEEFVVEDWKGLVSLMEELGIECLVGHPAKIRAAEPRKQKHDRRVADLWFAQG
jgi:sugar phosphate isomerase/epimerase